MRNVYSLSSLPELPRTEVIQYVVDFTNSPAGTSAELLPLRHEDVAGRLGVVACVDDVFVGYAGVKPYNPVECGVELGPFIVPPAYRRQGHGAALIARATHAALDNGFRPYVLANTTNLGNLRRMGFEPTTLQEIAPTTHHLCDPGTNIPVMLHGKPLQHDMPFASWPAGLSMLKMP